MKPGSYIGMSNEEYHSAPGLNSSKLKMMKDSPGLIKWAEKCPVDNDKLTTFNIGNALHCLVLEPGAFNARFAVEPDINKRTKAGKEEAEVFYSANAYRTIITAAENKQLRLMHGSILAHPDAFRLLENQTATERSIFADHDGVLLKARFDLESEIAGKKIISDLKTIDKIENIGKAIYDYGYPLQYAHYMAAYNAHHGYYPDFFFFIFITKSVSAGRYQCRVGELDQRAKDFGFSEWHRLRDEYAKCRNENRWPGIESFGLPAWVK